MGVAWLVEMASRLRLMRKLACWEWETLEFIGILDKQEAGPTVLATSRSSHLDWVWYLRVSSTYLGTASVLAMWSKDMSNPLAWPE